MRRPLPTDFAPPPSAARRRAWEEADRAARPARLARLRAKLAAGGFDAYFGLRREEIRYLTGVVLGEGEEKVAGHSGRFLVSDAAVVVLADSRYTVQVRHEAPDARLEPVTYDLPARWAELCASIGARRVAVPAADVSHALWGELAAAAPGVELVPAEAWVDADRAVKEPAEVERIEAACAVADRALAALLPEIRPGLTEAKLAWRLEVLMREGGAEALAFDVAALAGPGAALPHGAPGARRIRAGQVLLFDFGAQVAGYRSDMTRTLFVGEPRARDLAVYELVARAQSASIAYLEDELAAGRVPDGRAADGAARDVIATAGHGGHFGHGTGHGIGLATHEMPSLSRAAPETPLPSPTVFSVEPGVYLEGRTGVRIEDLVLLDVAARRVERLTRFPREVLVVG
jgi:Xaa-Pro aminopeptidase